MTTTTQKKKVPRLNYSPTVLYRKPRPVPTEPGWYYARWRDNPHRKDIEPVYVFPFNRVYGLLFENVIPDKFEWFGPVTEVRKG